MKAVSLGSLTAVLKRIIDKAPTIPKDTEMLLPITTITIVVTMVIITSDTLNLGLYITPE